MLGGDEMSYTELGGLVLGTGLLAAFICLLLHRIVHHDKLRHYHEVGYAVFLQLGVIFAVLLAFVFDNVWSYYNAASQVIDSECANLHGISILSDRLPSPDREAIPDALRAYLRTVIDREWPDMQRRNESQAAVAGFQLLWQTIETVNSNPANSQVHGQLLNLIATAHQSRETRLFQMEAGRPCADLDSADHIRLRADRMHADICGGSINPQSYSGRRFYVFSNSGTAHRARPRLSIRERTAAPFTRLQRDT